MIDMVFETKDLSDSVIHRLSVASDDIDDDVKLKLSEKKISYTYRQWMVLIALAYGNFCVASCVSLQAPFFPAECDKKNVTPQVYGLIFGVYELVILTFSPIFGKMLSFVSPNFFLQSGLFLAGGTTVLFGLLDRIPTTNDFTTLAFLLRIFEGIGASAFLTACYTLMPLEFPDNSSYFFAVLETFFGLGLIVGPTVGGALFEVGDYPLPFIVLGVLMLLGSFLSFAILPSLGSLVNNTKAPSLRKFINDWGVLLDILTISGVLNLIGFNAASLEAHLRQFNLTPTQVGSVFIITGSIYALTSSLWGKLSLCCPSNIRLMAFIGTVINIVGLLLLGPATFIPLHPQLWLVILSLVIVGIGMAAKLVGAYNSLTIDAETRRKYPKEASTHALVSAIYFSSCSAGAFLGPSIGGALLETIGYRQATNVILALEILTLIYLIIYQKFGPKIADHQPLLS